MDATYQTDLHQLDELNCSRFDTEFEHLMAELNAKIDNLRAEMRAEIAAQKSDLLKWMFACWAGTVIPLAGLMVALLR